jgi:MprA protease rhombosortase-interaction domain-containing protein
MDKPFRFKNYNKVLLLGNRCMAMPFSVRIMTAPVSPKFVKHTINRMKKNPFLKNSRTKALGTGAFLTLFMAGTALAQTPESLMSLKTTDGTTRLNLHKNGGLMVGGNFDGDISGAEIPMEGAGTRLMWYPGKGAFRAGTVEGTQWDAANIGSYSVAGGFNARSSGDYGISFGFNTTAANTGSVAMGQYSVASGAASVALGYNAHTNARQGSFVFADRSVIDDGNSMTDEYFRAGVNHSANWRVSGGFRVFTSSNLSTGVTIQSGASVSNWGQSNAVISTSTGAYLSTSGVWTNTSDSNRKHSIKPISGEEVLARLRKLPITQWSYRNEGDVKHLGPMAQDFRALFGLGSDEKVIGTVDADGVALAGVQALETRTRKQASELEILKAENKLLQERLNAMEKKTGINTAGFPLVTALLLAGAGLTGFQLRRRRVARKG